MKYLLHPQNCKSLSVWCMMIKRAWPSSYKSLQYGHIVLVVLVCTFGNFSSWEDSMHRSHLATQPTLTTSLLFSCNKNVGSDKDAPNISMPFQQLGTMLPQPGGQGWEVLQEESLQEVGVKSVANML